MCQEKENGNKILRKSKQTGLAGIKLMFGKQWGPSMKRWVIQTMGLCLDLRKTNTPSSVNKRNKVAAEGKVVFCCSNTLTLGKTARRLRD